MRIAHISDIHIRTLKFHDEYRKVFNNLYSTLNELKPDIIINTGDTCHTKTNISPEFVQITSEHIRQVCHIAPYHIILGNHDLNLVNLKRQDAISPIVDGMENSRVHLHTKSDFFHFGDKECYNFWVFSLTDKENWPTKERYPKNEINIGLFHGAVSDAKTDTNWTISHSENDISMFDGLDYTFLGDIHKRQDFKNGRIAYPGSLIQQNFGEELVKGFLLWDIESKDKFTKTFIELKGSRKFYTIGVNKNLEFDNKNIEEDSHIRIIPSSNLTLTEQKQLESDVKKLYKPHDVIILSDDYKQEKLTNKITTIEDLRQITEQEKLLIKFFKGRNISEDTMSSIFDINKKYQVEIEQSEDVARNTSWSIDKISWGNIFNYGSSNVVDFSSIGGVTGIFGQNAAGKSNYIDVILETLFDATTRSVGKNVFLINDNKDACVLNADITANGKKYTIDRSIERVKKKTETGKMICNFYGSNEKDNLVGDTRAETEKSIRRNIGSYEDMMLTSVSAQWNPLDIISCKETKRKEILSRFLDLDIFDKKHKLAKEESKKYKARLDNSSNDNIELLITECNSKISVLEDDISIKKNLIFELEQKIESIVNQIVTFNGKKVKLFEADEVTLKTNLLKLLKDKELLLSELTLFQKDICEEQEKVNKFKALSEQFDENLHKEKNKQLLSNNETLQQLNSNLKAYENDVAVHTKNADLLNNVPCGNSFPECRFLANAIKSKKALPSLIKKVDDTKTLISSLKDEISLLSSYSEKYEKFKVLYQKDKERKLKLQTLIARMQNVKVMIDVNDKNLKDTDNQLLQINNNIDIIKTNKEIDNAISVLQKDKILLETTLKNERLSLEQAIKQLGLNQGISEKLQSQFEDINKLKLIYKAYELYIEAMGKDGISYQVLTSKLPIINEEINKVLLGIAEFNVSIENDIEEQSIRIYIQYGKYKRRLIELGSGAEKMLASIALRVALLKISNLPKSNLFIIDEGFGKLDAKNVENINKMFDYLKSIFDHVFIVSHLDALKDMVDNSIEISQDEEGYAHIEVGA